MPGTMKKDRMMYMYGSRVKAADGTKMKKEMKGNKPHNNMDRMKMNIGGAMNVQTPN